MQVVSRRSEKAALAALIVTVALAAAKVAVWGATGSLAILSQALDSVLDIVALGLLFVGVRIAGKPADRTHHYGHGKAENLVVFAQTLILAGIVVAIGVEAIGRLTGEAERVTAPWYAVALLGISAVVDLVRVRLLLRTARSQGSDALRAGALNLATDVGTALVALASLVAVRAGIEQADAAGGLVVAAAVLAATVALGKRSVDVLMDRAPGGELAAIEAAAARAPGVAETRRVRVRGSGDRLFTDVTVAAGRTASLDRAHDIAEAVEVEIAKVAPGIDVVVHVEPATEKSSLVERVLAAATRTPGVHEVHNVVVHAVEEGGTSKLHTTLHAKVAPGTSLREAHAVSDRIEDAVRSELGPHVRVDSHIEPLQDTARGRDVTLGRGDVVATVKQIAEAEPDVLDCHEVVVTSLDSRLAVVAHVSGREDLPLARIHEASERIENAVRAAHQDVASVVIHFEPA